MMSASRSKHEHDHFKADVSPTNAVASARGAVAPVIFSGVQPTGRKDLGSHIDADHAVRHRCPSEIIRTGLVTRGWSLLGRVPVTAFR